MKIRHTHFDLIKTISTAIASWMEHGTVVVNKFLPKDHQAINLQYYIGWNQFFMAQISQEFRTKTASGGGTVVQAILVTF